MEYFAEGSEHAEIGRERAEALVNDMVDKQVQLGWIKRHPDFLTTHMLNDSAPRKAAARLGIN